MQVSRRSGRFPPAPVPCPRRETCGSGAQRQDRPVLANRSNQLPDLPTSFRGYDRDTIDQYLEQVEAGYLGLAAERDELREQVEDLTRELKRYRKREDK